VQLGAEKGRTLAGLSFRRCAMGTGASLKKQGVVGRVVEHPVGALLGGLVTAVVFGILGMVHGETVAVVVAVIGALMGAPLGAMTAASAQNKA
jgi:hypothetical protein